MEVSSSDQTLVENILNGDDNAFTQLYERYRRPVYCIAYRVIRDPEETQDATQEIFAKLYRHLHRWDGRKSKLSTWIHRLARNHSIDCHRTRCRRAEFQLWDNGKDRHFRVCVPGYFAQSPYTSMKNREEIAIVRHCVGNLPDLQRKTFVQRYFHERKLAEIAEMECCKLATVKTSLHRARKAVRKVLSKSRKLSLNNVASPA